MKKQTVRTLAECGILIALGTVLSLVKLEMPFGGSITLFSMLPLVIICWRNGPKWGFLSALVYAFLQIVTGVSTVSAMFLPGDSQMLWWKAIIVCLLDYILAFTLIGFSSFFRGKHSPSASLAVGALVGLSLRYLCHTVSGAIFYGSWAEWFFEEKIGGELGAWFLSTFTDPAVLGTVYSAVYNGIYMSIEIVLTVVAAVIIGKLPFISKNCPDGALPPVRA